MTTASINGKAVKVAIEDDTPLLWVIRDEIGLTGTKFGCGIGMCGAHHHARRRRRDPASRRSARSRG